MPSADTLPRLLPVAAAFALLLAAGLAALVHLASRARPPAPPWRIALARCSAASPWRGRDLAMLLAALAAARAVRFLLGPSIAWDMLTFQGAMIAGVCWLARGKPRPFGAALPARAVAGQATLRWLAILPILWAAALSWQLLLVALGHAPDFQDAVRLFLAVDDPWARAGFILFATVLAPIAEEALFRGMLLPILIRRLGAAAGLALTALAFAALHADAGTFLALALFSVALSMACARTGTLWVPIGMHMLFNGANLALLLALSRAGAV